MDDVFMWIKEFNDEYFPGWEKTPDIYLSNAIAGECGELCNAIKHYYKGGTNNKKHSNDKKDVFIELADIFIYMALLLMTNNKYDKFFKELIWDKIQENKNRMDNNKDIL